MKGTRWIFRALTLVVVCALPALAFAADVSTPVKPVGKPVQSLSPSVTTGKAPAAPTHNVQTAPPKLELNQIASPVSPNMAKTVQNLSDQVASLKKEVDQLKKSGQTQSNPQPQPKPQPYRRVR